MTINRVRVTWSGVGVVGPSVSTFYFGGSDSGFTAAIGTYFTSIANLLPNDVTIFVPNTGDQLNETTGVITGGWVDGTNVTVPGTDTGAFQIGAGARNVLDTAGVVNGRHVRGTIFLVPLGLSAFSVTGRVSPTPATTIVNAASALINSANNVWQVWSRPIPGRAGSVHPVTSSHVPDVPTALRSRRY